MCLASVMLVVAAHSVIGFTVWFIEEIPFQDTKCPKYLISVLTNLHLDILYLIPASQNFSKTNCIYFRCSSSVLLYINKSAIQNSRKLSKYSKKNINMRFRKMLGAVFTPKTTLFHWNFPYGQVKTAFVWNLDVLKYDDTLI